MEHPREDPLGALKEDHERQIKEFEEWREQTRERRARIEAAVAFHRSCLAALEERLKDMPELANPLPDHLEGRDLGIGEQLRRQIFEGTR